MPTEWNPVSMRFARLKGRDVVADFGGGAEIGARGHDAEDAGEPGRAHGVGRMGRLPGVADDPEDLAFGEVEDRQPVEPDAACAGVALVQLPRRLPCTRRAFLGTHAHGADDPAAEARVGLEVAAKFPLDGPAFQRARTPPDFRGGEPAPLLDAVEQALAGRDRRQDQGHAGRERRPNELNNSTVPGHSTSPSGACTATIRSRGTFRDSTMLIACESLPPLVLLW